MAEQERKQPRRTGPSEESPQEAAAPQAWAAS